MNAILTPSFIRNQPYGGLAPNGGTFPFVKAMQNTERDIEGTNFQFKILTDPYELDEAFRLRYEVFCNEMKVANPANYSNGRETDDYDSACLHTAITEEGRMVAYTRLVLPCEQFPIEKASPLPKIFDRGRSVEVSRGLLTKDRRGPENVFWHLSNCLYELCQEDDIDALLSFSNTVMYNGYKKRGVPFRYVGDPVTFHGHRSHPLIIDISQQRTPNFLLH